MHANLLAQSDHVSGDELRAKGVIAATLAGIEIKDMEKIGKPGEKSKKGIMRFSETGAKPWIINKTNVEILKAIMGDGRCGKPGGPKEHVDGKCVNTDHWLGHKIGLGPNAQKVSGKPVDGVVVCVLDSLTKPMDVVVELRGRAARTYTVNPPKPASTPDAGGSA